MKALLAVLVVLAMTAVSSGEEPEKPGPGAWKLSRYGLDPTDSAPAGTAAGNAKTMEVRAGPGLTRVRALAIVDLLSSNQDGTAQKDAEAWFTLSFCGSKDAVNHKWEISTCINGDGVASAGADVDGDSWGESVEVIEYTGDNESSLHGQLVVASSGSTGVIIGLPPSFHVTLEKRTRSQLNDTYELEKKKTTAGPGKLCRVKVRTYAKAHVSAKSKFGAGTASVQGYLRGDLVMKGFCSIGAKEFEDSFVLEDDVEDNTYSKSSVNPPEGGIEEESGTPPPTKPTAEERALPPDADAKPPAPPEDAPASQTEPAEPTEEEAAPDPDGTSSPAESGGATSPGDTEDGAPQEG